MGFLPRRTNINVNKPKKRTYVSTGNGYANDQNGAKRRRNNATSTPCHVKTKDTQQPFQFKPDQPFLSIYNRPKFEDFKDEPKPENDNFNESSVFYEELKDKATIFFNERHLISENHDRKKILNFCRRLLGGRKCYREKVYCRNSFLQGVLNASGEKAQLRYEEMLKNGFFGNSRRNTRNTIILSRKDGMVLHIARLRRSMFKFDLMIEIKPFLMEHLGRNKKKLINHYSAEPL